MKKKLLSLVFLLAAVICTIGVYAQTVDGNAGINQANTTIRGYFDAATNLMYAVGAILGIIGALRVYDRWVHGHNETNKYAAAWIGGCIFLVIASTVIKSFFGL